MKKRINRIINKIVKVWYKIPRYKLTIRFQKQHVDERSFAWYLERKLFGFDERILWNLSMFFHAMIKESLQRQESNKEKYITLEEFTAWFKKAESTKDIKWFYDRVCKYIEWECPYDEYIKGKFLSKQEIKDILDRYKHFLLLRIENGTISDSMIEFLYEYDRFGW